MEHSIVSQLDAITPNYPAKQLSYSMRIVSKVRLFKRKLLRGYEVSLFQKRGNGIKTILDKVGRLTDVSGLFVISSATGEALILGSSKSILNEIQQLTRAKRAKDKKVLERVAGHFGFNHYKMGRELLLPTHVNWIEVTDKSFRLMLKRAMMAHVKYVL